MTDKITTRHPQGKQGVRIDRAKYDAVRQAIVDELAASKEMTFSGLAQAVEEQLAGRFAGSIPWYYTTVKLDLEARGVVVRSGTGSPQRLTLAQDGS